MLGVTFFTTIHMFEGKTSDIPHFFSPSAALPRAPLISQPGGGVRARGFDDAMTTTTIMMMMMMMMTTMMTMMKMMMMMVMVMVMLLLLMMMVTISFIINERSDEKAP